MDAFHGHTNSLTAPARRAAAVTPSESPIGQVTRAIYVGVSGNLRVEMAGGDRVLFQNLPAGTFLPIRATHVLEDGTTAGAILALW